MARGSHREWMQRTAQDLMLAAPDSKLDAEAMQGRILTFEQGMGVLLRCAFEHVEAVQTTDLPELLEHASEVLRSCSQAAPESITFERSQPALLLRYLASIMLRVSDDKVSEDKVMPLMRELGLVSLVAAHVSSHREAFKPEDLSAGLHFLSRCCETEALCDQPQAFLPSDIKAELKQNFDTMLRDLPTEERRSLRPLLDAMQGQGPFRY